MVDADRRRLSKLFRDALGDDEVVKVPEVLTDSAASSVPPTRLFDQEDVNQRPLPRHNKGSGVSVGIIALIVLVVLMFAVILCLCFHQTSQHRKEPAALRKAAEYAEDLKYNMEEDEEVQQILENPPSLPLPLPPGIHATRGVQQQVSSMRSIAMEDADSRHDSIRQPRVPESSVDPFYQLID